MSKHTAEKDERLTEAEWRQREARIECGRFGHDWTITETISGPVTLFCSRPCGTPVYRVLPPVMQS